LTPPFTEKEASTFKLKRAGAPKAPQEEEEVKMVKRALGILTVTLLLTAQSQGANLKVEGGISAALYDQVGEKSRGKLRDLVVELEGKEPPVKFDLAVGTLLLATVTSSAEQENRGNFGVGSSDAKWGLLWGYAELKLPENFTLQWGVLSTNLGFELPESYDNPNALFGLVWSGQPFIYKGVRLKKEFSAGRSAYFEYDRGRELNGNTKDHAVGAGLEVNGGSSSFSFNYFNYGSYKTLLDALFYRELPGGDEVAFNLDYQFLNSDSSKGAVGAALYLIPKFNRLELPLRFEVVKEWINSNLYQLNGGRAVSFTVSPTYRLNRWNFRAEFAKVSANKPAFNGHKTENSLVFQVSYLF